MRSVVIRDMEKNDIDFVLELGEQTKELWASNELKFPFTRKDLIGWINSKGEDELLVAEFNEELVGFSISKVDYTTAEIISLVIKKEYRNKKIGTKLFKETFKRLRKKGVKKYYLYVIADNSKAIKFYKKCGFKLGHNAYFMYKGSWK
jgi:ribosomal protein S18 acetylase RimI-like enzyme